MLSEQRNFLID
uniref:Uncharacterized protein n=1 Tax=Rhizophora mucronata TaxID=61149 RepID=A0A2P2PZF1_RHIMU